MIKRSVGPLLLLGLLALAACPEEQGDRDGGEGQDAAQVDTSSFPDANVLRDTNFPPHDAGPGCGEVPTEGRCTTEDVLQWCEDGQVQEADCAALGLICDEKPSLGGFWCLAGPGQSCLHWPCQGDLVCGDFNVCAGVVDAGLHDAGSAEDGGAEDSAADQG